ncbi:MFS transporter [Celeribacter neptunius]|uniref:Predicted arabinose efflux permease, MFS family n=1 Tax=Celeribacter neptunius TaxID=588602 RepID=A0A1I3WUN6_9RHOB|nr:MFS transporter [Celeribacter neptunius]SFK11202.1 Predicted arabinose efflux permease, MFS family [Celeribacter neptunius]
MVKGIFWLIVAYGLSQFYRACLAVFAPVLKIEIGLGTDHVSAALGIWFLVFAAMQIPVGWLLDHRSPKATAAGLLALGGGLGALTFALAQGPGAVKLSMALIGMGCSPVLMASLYIIARSAPADRFGTFTGLVLGLGSLGNVAAATPLALSLEAIGWRWTMVGLAGLSALVALALYRFVEDPPHIEHDVTAPRAGLGELLRLRALYPILLIALVAYAPGAGLRGSWIGSFLSDMLGAGMDRVGGGALWMALAMIAGSLAFGPIDRLIRSHKAIVSAAAFLTLLPLLLLWAGYGAQSFPAAVGLFVVIGFFASSYPQVMSHGRSLIPPELVGRGVTLINLFSIGGVGLSQLVTARLFAHASETSLTAGYAAVFGYFSLTLLLCLVIYLIFARDPKPGEG